MALLGIDVSNNNPGVDMAAAAQQGVEFCIAKASQGWAGGPGGWMDWTWQDVVTRARRAGIIPGGYHWALKGNGAQQAQQFVASLASEGGPAGFLCALDIEATSWTPGLDIDPALSVDPSTVDEFLAEWDQLAPGHPIFLYGASWYHDGYMHAGARWPDRPLWWANYPGGYAGPIERTWPAAAYLSMAPGFGGWTSAVIRQFTSSAIAGGVEVDADVCQLTREQLLTYTAPPGASPGKDWFDMATQADLVAAVRQVLNEGTGKGQTGWAGTNQALLAIVQANVNTLNEIQGELTAMRAAAVKAGLMPAPAK